ncbi:methyltransferase [Candidatus Saccharibacteria bacterium]|nr:methyltransferase [Candidatus Saccharibacteria bacterium]
MVEFSVHDTKLQCATAPDLFSPKGLDKGTELLLEQLSDCEWHQALDWGCGWGAMALWLAKCKPQSSVIGLDSDIGAIKVAQANAHHNNLANCQIIASHGYDDLDDILTFDLIVSNPPTHRGREVVEHMIRESFQRLNSGGKLFIVVEARLKPWVERSMRQYDVRARVIARTQKHTVLRACK